jgi:hypothetical protein
VPGQFGVSQASTSGGSLYSRSSSRCQADGIYAAPLYNCDTRNRMHVGQRQP